MTIGRSSVIAVPVLSKTVYDSPAGVPQQQHVRP